MADLTPRQRIESDALIQFVKANIEAHSGYVGQSDTMHTFIKGMLPEYKKVAERIADEVLGQETGN